MSWKNVISMLAVGVMLGLPFGTLANDRNDRDRRDNDRYDRDRHERERAEREAAERRKKAERDARYESQLIARYSTLTGSAANATSLVKGLHNDTTVTLTRITTIVVTLPPLVECPPPRFEQPPGCGQPRQETQETTETESFNPPTRPLHYKGVAIALAIMEAKLKDANPGITAATPAQIKEVLVGTPNGILTLRGAKKSWFRIAQLQGFAVGGHAGTAKPKQVNKKGHKYDHDNDDDDDDDD